MNRIESLYYPLIKVLRKENKIKKEYVLDSPNVKVINADSNECILELPAEDFLSKAELLLSVIKESRGAFDAPEVERFMSVIHCAKVSADSFDKSDIQIVLHDKDTLRDSLFGFSIKSRLGSPSTLLNAGATTNFTYKINGGITEEEIAEINAISTRSKIKDRINTILAKGYTFEFVEADNSNFSSNLQVIDTALPKIVSGFLLYYYQGISVKVDELTQKLTEKNPCNYYSNNGHSFYEYKVKNLLSDIALGMTPAEVWTGRIDATGGYIVVKEDGDILCYHLYNRNEFQDYLFKNTRLETASSSRHGFGEIYYANGKSYIKLNLQVRFL